MPQNPSAPTACPIYPEAWNAGVEAGLLKDRRHPPAGMDRYSFYAGLMEGKSMRAHASQQAEVSELARQLTHWTPRQKKILRRLCSRWQTQE